jgi:hypothetical protein
MSEPEVTKREKMLFDEDVRRWYENMSRGSPISAEVNLRRLSLFCEKHTMSPKALVEMARTDRKKAGNLVLDLVTRMEDEKKSPGYISGMVKAVRSWLRHNDADLKMRIKITNPNATPSIENERVPTQEELKTILVYAGERAKVSIVLIAMAGLRPETIGNESGTDGLRLKDMPEMGLDDHVRFDRVPTRIVVRASLSKARHKYFTFLPKEGCEYVIAYLEKRIAKGEKLTPDSPIITVASGYERMGKSERNKDSKFITTRNVTREIREAIRPRFSWRPYVLRAYFDSQMLLAENNGNVIPAYRTFFMGHKGDMEARYTTHKGALPDHLTEDMRKSFEKCDEYLSTVQTKAVDLEKVKIESLLAFAKVQGFPEETINSVREAVMKEKDITSDTVADLLKKASADLRSSFYVRKPNDETEKQASHIGNNGKPFQSKIVGEKEITGYVEEGWEILKELRSGKFLIKRPNNKHD